MPARKSHTDSKATQPLWKERFRTPHVLKTKLALSNSTHGLAVVKDERSIHLAAWQVEGGKLHRLVDARDGWISPDGNFVYYLQDFKGSELGHVVRLPFNGGEAVDLTPQLPDYTLRGFDVSRAGNLLAFDAVSAAGYQYYLIDRGAQGERGTPRLLYQSTVETWESLLSHGGEILVAKTSATGERRRYTLIALDTNSGETLASFSSGSESNSEPVMFSPRARDMRLLASTTAENGFKHPVIWDPISNERRDIVLPHLEGEIEALDWSPDAELLLLRQSHMAQHQLYTYDLRDDSLEKINHPRGSIGGTGGMYHSGQSSTFFGPDGKVWAHWQNGATPPQLLPLDAETGAECGTLLKLSAAPPGRSLRSVTYTSSDGATIQGWLGVPEGAPPFPAILHVHGGPHATVTDLYSPGIQSWLDHGFAYFSINFRGSLGFGLDFRAKIEGQIGRWELEDMVAARQWLIDEGVAKRDGIFLHGGSYGGYLTLLGLGKRPGLWAGGLGLVVLADWTEMYADASDALKGFSRVLFGGSPDEQPERYRESSAITYVENVTAPLLVIQGRHDSRTPARQFERYAARMEELGKLLEIVWFDAGHGSGDVEQMIEFQEKMIDFARRVLGRNVNQAEVT